MPGSHGPFCQRDGLRNAVRDGPRDGLRTCWLQGLRNGVRDGPRDRLRACLPQGLVWFIRGRQVEPDGGTGRLPEVSPLGREVLDEKQPVSVGRVEIALDDGRAGRAAVDDLDEDAAWYPGHDDGHGAALDTRFGVHD